MSELSPADLQRRQRRLRWSLVATTLRCGLVVLIAALLRLQIVRSPQSTDSPLATLAPQLVAAWLPEATQVDGAVAVTDSPQNAAANPIRAVRDSTGRAIGAVMTTLPQAADVIGYRGPSNTLLVLDEQSTVIGAQLLSSEDTPEHVAAILKDESFFRQFAGWTPGVPESVTDVDAVSGATLTSLAIIEGITLAMGADKPSLRFPDAFTPEDLALVDAADLQLGDVSQFEAGLVDADGRPAGRIIRTGPLVDSVSGYQGPSEVLMRVREDGTTDRIALRTTYDNDPYAGYLNQEKYFWKVFREKTVSDVAEIDLIEEQVEGVSGATMTSMAVAETIVASAAEWRRRQQQSPPPGRTLSLRLTAHDYGTVCVLAIGILINLTSLRRRKWLRNAWNVTLVGYFGLVTGNLISLAVVSGWAVRGIAWQLAPGLAAVVVVSFLMSAVAGRNVYCSHICPHGALQQLLRRPRKTPARLRQVLRRTTWLPGGLLLLAAISTWLQWGWNLAAWEPFNAYIWYVAGTASLVVAGLSIALAWYIPMGYCRHACGTGRLLDYVRRSASAVRFTMADGMVVTLAVAMTVKLLWSGF